MKNRNLAVWDKEYREFKLITKALSDTLQSDLAAFLRWLRREQGFEVYGSRILDLGSGAGRNATYLAKFGAQVSGLEFSQTAVNLARDRAKQAGVVIDYQVGDIGASYPYPDREFDLVLDVTSSNSLDERGRQIYLEETARVLKSDGWLFVRALCKDGDKNAQNLLKQFPGPEKDTYVMPELGLTERVFRRADLIDTYSPFFEIVQLTKTAQYTKFKGQSYKRHFWIGHLRRK